MDPNLQTSNGSTNGNLKKAVIALFVPLPSILFYLVFLRQYQDHVIAATSGDGDGDFSLSPLWTWCYLHPFLLANVFFFFNVNLLFWIIGLAQSSHWMIDLYWTVIPILLVNYYASHPLAEYDVWRSRVVIVLTWVWAIRLTHNYFRREKWQWGAREDWRFTDMCRQYGKNWWWVSFFAVYLSQQVFLLGVTLPFYAVHFVNKPSNIWDFVAIAICITGIAIAYFADTQLHNFVTKNEESKALGKPMVPNLEEGLWKYSRHPNYFGEQLWWWGLVIFGWNLGCGWTFVGPLINSLCLAYVTILVENRMVQQDYRAEAYRCYQKTTSVWIPWFKLSPKASKDKNA